MTPAQIRAVVLRHVAAEWRSSHQVADSIDAAEPDGVAGIGWRQMLDALHELVDRGEVERGDNEPISHTLPDGSVRMLRTSQWRAVPR